MPDTPKLPIRGLCGLTFYQQNHYKNGQCYLTIREVLQLDGQAVLYVQWRTIKNQELTEVIDVFLQASDFDRVAKELNLVGGTAFELLREEIREGFKMIDSLPMKEGVS